MWPFLYKPQVNFTRLLGRFASIFYFNCEHFLFVYIVKRKRKSLRIFLKIVDFENLLEIEFCWRQIFVILIIHKPSLGHVMSHTKFGPDRFSRFNVYWIKQTDKQTEKQSKYREVK